MSYKTIQVPMISDDLETVLSTKFILLQHYKGDPFISKPYKVTGVSLVDAELSRSGITRDENDKAVKFVCDRCKKQFSAEKAHGFIVKTDGYISTSWERAFCGRCASKTKKLIDKLLEAVDEFDDTRPYTDTLPVKTMKPNEIKGGKLENIKRNEPFGGLK